MYRRGCAYDIPALYIYMGVFISARSPPDFQRRRINNVGSGRSLPTQVNNEDELAIRAPVQLLSFLGGGRA